MPDTCGRCGRRLKDPFFREIGYGRTCAAKLGITLPQKKKRASVPTRRKKRRWANEGNRESADKRCDL